MNIIDLHLHTTASDGQHSPRELAELARQNGNNLIAITDHDTIAGAAEAPSLSDETLTVIPGIELSASEYRQLHILGYNLNSADERLLSLCQSLKEGRDKRKYLLIDFLNSKSIDITLDEVEEIAKGEIIARPHFARAMVKRGDVKTTREAFDLYLDTDEFHKIERNKPTAAECISVIHNAGGVAVWAHPTRLDFDDFQISQLLKELIGWGIDGIESYYSTNTPEESLKYIRLAKKNSLFSTAGSDFHGKKVKPDISIGKWKFAILPFKL